MMLLEALPVGRALVLKRRTMKVSKRVLKYAELNLKEVLHTTLNPEGPGVVRIHLVPPKIEGNNLEASVAIVNGMDIVPVNVSWTILLAEFIKEVNKYSGREITAEETESILNNACKNVQRVFWPVSKRILKNDIYRIMKTFTQIAYGEEPDESVEYINLGDYAPNMTAPHRMDLMVSAMTKDGIWHCNQKCIHCYAAGQERAEEVELSTDEWKTIIDICKDAKIPQLTFTGGEPTMREDLTELIRYAGWFVTRLNTNGIKLTREYCKELYDASLDSVQITFYSENEEIHNKLVGASQYQNTVAGIKNAIAAGLNISINTPLCTLNKDYVKTLEFLHNMGIIYVTCSGLITTGNALSEDSRNLRLSEEEMKQILTDAVGFCCRNGMEISFTSPGWIEKEFFDMYGLSMPSCGACLSNMAVTPGGNVVPCQSWLSEETLGNMIGNEWSDIWNGAKCREHREFSASVFGICPLRRHNED